MRAQQRKKALAKELDEALSLLKDYREFSTLREVSEPLPSLLAQCNALCDQIKPPEPIRMIHHLACTGGTLLSKCIAALPNVILLSEIDPLSKMGLVKPGKKPPFAPTDVIRALNHSQRSVGDDLLVEVFRAEMGIVLSGLTRQGLRTVLRDHPHSQFCTKVDFDARPTVREILMQDFPVLALVTVRHPLDSFLSLQKNEWAHFDPFTLEEYSRRVSNFLDRHMECPIVKYEDFTSDPTVELQRMCDILALPFNSLSTEVFSAVHLTGDSGRSGSVIAARPRSALSQDIEAQRSGAAYRAVCERMGYEP